MNTKFRKVLSLVLCVLLCISLFAGCGGNNAETQPQDVGIKNIILIIGDGMGPAQIELGELALGEEFVFRGWQNTFCNTNSIKKDGGEAAQTTDSAAAATALATGTLTTNGHVGLDAAGNELKTIMDYAKEYGKSTGVVSTDDMDGATPAGFSGHSPDRRDQETILKSQTTSGVDLLCSNYTGAVYALAGPAGYEYCDFYSSIQDTMSADKVWWQFSMAGASPADKLEKVTVDALNYLDKNEKGFVVMIEQAHIDKYCHDNGAETAAMCSISLNNTVKAVLNWIGDRKDTAVIVTADHETGGLEVSKENKYPYSFVSQQGNTVYYKFASEDHTPTPVYAYFHGFDPKLSQYAMDSSGEIIKNTAIFQIMLELLKNPKQP